MRFRYRAVSPYKKQETRLELPPCPKCGALAGEFCISGGKTYWSIHKQRRQKEKPVRDLSNLWRLMKPWEGEHAKRCPAWLREMFSRAGAA